MALNACASCATSSLPTGSMLRPAAKFPWATSRVVAESDFMGRTIPREREMRNSMTNTRAKAAMAPDWAARPWRSATVV